MISLFSAQTLPASLEDLRQEWKDCARCALRPGCRAPVFWSGPERADLMLVGEAPGEEEDRKGLPFVGAAGRRLDEYLRMLLGSDARDLVHVGNSVLCRPNDGRRNLPPDMVQVTICSERLRQEIALVSPKVVVTLGKFATFSVLRQIGGLDIPADPRMTPLRGRTFRMEVEGRPLVAIPTWHPSYELRAVREGRTDVSQELSNDLAGAVKLAGLTA